MQLEIENQSLLHSSESLRSELSRTRDENVLHFQQIESLKCSYQAEKEKCESLGAFSNYEQRLELSIFVARIYIYIVY